MTLHRLHRQRIFALYVIALCVKRICNLFAVFEAENVHITLNCTFSVSLSVSRFPTFYHSAWKLPRNKPSTDLSFKGVQVVFCGAIAAFILSTLCGFSACIQRNFNSLSLVARGRPCVEFRSKIKAGMTNQLSYHYPAQLCGVVSLNPFTV